MKGESCELASCSSTPASLGGVAAGDFAVLDALAVKLVCLDCGFSAPVRQIGRVLGERIAMAQSKSNRPIGLDAALSPLISACGLQGAVEFRLIQHSAGRAQLQLTGCAKTLGFSVPHVGRTVCGFDAGLFEGFLSGVTGKACSVEETACLGLGHPSCEFLIHRVWAQQGPG